MTYRTPPFKYITVVGEFGPEMIIFSEVSSHKQVARGKEVLSAGFLMLEVDENGQPNVQVYGKSVTLDIGPRPEDAALARVIFRNDY